MTFTIDSLNIGIPKTLYYQGKKVKSSFGKEPTAQGRFLFEKGFEGDGQADLINHGGEEKAVLFYPSLHYAYWEKHYSRAFAIPSFGENITISDITEKDVSIGDVFRLGEAVVQICQPRHPCFKISAFHEIKDIAAMVTNTGYSGFYARVLQEGMVFPTSKLTLEQRAEEPITIADIFLISARSSVNLPLMEKVIASPYAATTLKETLQKKKEKLSRI